MVEYTKKVMEHFLHPKNMGEIKNPDAEAQVGNPVCGDVMKIQIKVENNQIKDIKFKTLGCAAAIATSSVLTELAKGKTLEEAEKISRDDIVKALGGLPPHKLHCSVLAHEALKKAIENYKKKYKPKNKSK
ncbi:iron-sulfur cluster assembly scaffold protein [Candidatus Heimdallarchaeota archaeon]|nr:MAG: iron-sulfur cluster assembly scaffold protein [Candidatus Heimdallarchaeota archaeon]